MGWLVADPGWWCDDDDDDFDNGKTAITFHPHPLTGCSKPAHASIRRTAIDGGRTSAAVKRIWLALLIAFARVTVSCHTVRPFVAQPPKPFGFWWVCPVDPLPSLHSLSLSRILSLIIYIYIVALTLRPRVITTTVI